MKIDETSQNGPVTSPIAADEITGRLDVVEHTLRQIQARNARVESEKAWETSLTRSVSIIVISYVLIVVVMFVLNMEDIFVNAALSALGYFISIQSLPVIKRWWIRRQR